MVASRGAVVGFEIIALDHTLVAEAAEGAKVEFSLYMVLATHFFDIKFGIEAILQRACPGGPVAEQVAPAYTIGSLIDFDRGDDA